MCYLKITCSCDDSVNFDHIPQNATLATEFRPSHRFTQPRQSDSQKTRGRNTFEMLHLPSKMKMDTSKLLRLLRKLQLIFWQYRQSFAPAMHNNFRRVPKHVRMSRSATRNEIRQCVKPPQVTSFAELTIGTAIVITPLPADSCCERPRS